MAAPAVTEKLTRAGQREATRGKLIDATFALLVEKGYAGTTTALVAERAGVSHGALFNHFASREDLMVACIDEVFPRFMAEGSEQLLGLATSPDRSLEAVVDALWHQFSGATLKAMRELMTVARTNDAMSESLARLDEVMQPANVQLAGLLVPDLAGHPDLPALIGLTLATIDGAVFAVQAFHNPARHADSKRMLVRALELLHDEALRTQP